MLARTTPDTAAAIIGSLGRRWRVISCKLEHRVGKVVITKASIAIGMMLGLTNRTLRTVALGERNKGMNGMNSPVGHRVSKIPKFGNKGSLMTQSCKLRAPPKMG